MLHNHSRESFLFAPCFSIYPCQQFSAVKWNLTQIIHLLKNLRYRIFSAMYKISAKVQCSGKTGEVME